MVMMRSISTLDVPVPESRKDHLGHVSWNNLNLYFNVWKKWPKESKCPSLSSADSELISLTIMNSSIILSRSYPTTRKDLWSISSFTRVKPFWKDWTLPKTETFHHCNTKKYYNFRRISRSLTLQLTEASSHSKRRNNSSNKMVCGGNLNFNLG